MFTIFYEFLTITSDCNTVIVKIVIQSDTHRLLLNINPHMHKMGPLGLKHYSFGHQFYSKNVRMVRLNEFFNFHTIKHMILSFYLKWTEFTRNFDFFSNSV